MRYTVWHEKEPNFGMGDHPEFNETNFVPVAIVETESIDEVYRVTNHIDKPWWENPEVVMHSGTPRSTSVGDVVVAESGATYRCEMVGWSKI